MACVCSVDGSQSLSHFDGRGGMHRAAIVLRGNASAGFVSTPCGGGPCAAADQFPREPHVRRRAADFTS